jgi:RNA polymerase sigma-70 factor (ECF subfamily)
MAAEVVETLRMTKNSAAESSSVAPLIHRARSGEREAFDQLMILHQRKVVSVAWRLLGNEEDARDAAQEAFLKAYKYLHRFDADQDFAGWLYRIVVNVCRDLARKRGKHAGASLETECAAGNLREPVSKDDTEAAAILAQEQEIIARALATLTEKERAALVLRDLEGLPTEEVARILGSSPATVRSQISMARAKIKAFRARWLQGARPKGRPQ